MVAPSSPRIKGSGTGVKGLGCRGELNGARSLVVLVAPSRPITSPGSRIQGSGSGVWGWVDLGALAGGAELPDQLPQGSGFGVQGPGFGVFANRGALVGGAELPDQLPQGGVGVGGGGCDAGPGV